jgi:hypothetical protein
MINECGAIGGIKISVEAEVLGEIPPQCHFVHHKSHMTCPEIEIGSLCWEAGEQPPGLWHGPCPQVSLTQEAG